MNLLSSLQPKNAFNTEWPRVERVLVRVAVILPDRRLLMLQRSKSERFLPGRWELPAGSRDAWENPTVSIQRELIEEASLEVPVEKLVPYSTSAFATEKPSVQIIEDWVNINYMVQLASEPSGLVLSEDHDDLQWLSVQDAMSLMPNDTFGYGPRHALLTLPV